MGQKQGSNVACTGCLVAHSDNVCTENKFVLAMFIKRIMILYYAGFKLHDKECETAW